MSEPTEERRPGEARARQPVETVADEIGMMVAHRFSEFLTEFTSIIEHDDQDMMSTQGSTQGRAYRDYVMQVGPPRLVRGARLRGYCLSRTS